MFESLSDKLEGVFKRLSGKGKLTEADVDVALREVRMALLEADVNLKVVRQFLDRVRVRAIGAEVMESLTPAQAVIKIVNEELIATLGEPAKLDVSGPAPHVLMLVGLQGAGKTTTAAKLALHLRKQGHRPLMVAADTRRPAAIQQLQTLGKQLDISVFAEDTKIPPPQICVDAVKHATQNNYTIVILDTAGRLHIDDDLMNELGQALDAAEQERQAGANRAAAAEGAESGGARSAMGPRESALPTGAKAPPAESRASLPNRFFGTVEIDPDRASLDFSTVVSEVLQHFTAQTGVQVKVTVEIQASHAPGFEAALQRAVKENCGVLRFRGATFERE